MTYLFIIYLITFIAVLILSLSQAFRGNYNGMDLTKYKALDNIFGFILQLLLGFIMLGGFFYLARLIVAPLPFLKALSFQEGDDWISLFDITYAVMGFGVFLLTDSLFKRISNKHKKTE